MRALSDIEKGYIAGLLDGEGCISIIQYVSGRKWTAFATYLCIENTDRKMIEYLVKTTGVGSVKERRHINPHHKTSYRWQISVGADIINIMSQITDHLVTKKEQALLLLEFAVSRANRVWNRAPYTDKEIRIVDKIKTLNKRGVHTETNSSSVGTAQRRRPHLV